MSDFLLSGNAALRPWVLRAGAPLLIMAANACGVAFTPERITKLALMVLYTTTLSAAAVYWRIARDDDRVRTVRFTPVPGAPEQEVTVREYDTRQLRELCSSVAVGLGTAWALHIAGVTSNLLVLQTVLLPLTVFEHELVRLHVRGESESEPGLRRPFASEPAKLMAAVEEVKRRFATTPRPAAAAPGRGKKRE